jgi:hypothetical protein
MNYKSLQEWCAKGTSHLSQISWKTCKILKEKKIKNKYVVKNFKKISN